MGGGENNKVGNAGNRKSAAYKSERIEMSNVRLNRANADRIIAKILHEVVPKDLFMKMEADPTVSEDVRAVLKACKPEFKIDCLVRHAKELNKLEMTEKLKAAPATKSPPGKVKVK